MRVTIILALGMLFSVAAGRAQGDDPFKMRTESAVYENSTADGGWVRKTVNKRFDFMSVDLGGERGFHDLLFLQIFDQTFRSGEEGSTSRVTVTAFMDGKRKYDTTLWTASHPADAGGLWEGFYRMTKYGCCGAENVATLFHLPSGVRVVSFTGEPVFVEIPNTPIRRVVSYISANGAEGFDGETKGVIGLLTLSSDERIIDRLLFFSDSLDLAWTPKILLTSPREPAGVATRLDLWDSEKTASALGITGFGVKLLFVDGSEATVPVVRDRFDIDAAITKANIRMQRK
jgi:hypothetical protein